MACAPAGLTTMTHLPLPKWSDHRQRDKENVPGQAQNGTKIRMYEFYNDEWSVQPNDSWVSQDGTFSNTAVFTGKYKILAEGPLRQ